MMRMRVYKSEVPKNYSKVGVSGGKDSTSTTTCTLTPQIEREELCEADIPIFHPSRR